MGVSNEALGVIPGRTAPSADLGGSKLTPMSLMFTVTSRVLIDFFYR